VEIGFVDSNALPELKILFFFFKNAPPNFSTFGGYSISGEPISDRLYLMMLNHVILIPVILILVILSEAKNLFLVILSEAKNLFLVILSEAKNLIFVILSEAKNLFFVILSIFLVILSEAKNLFPSTTMNNPSPISPFYIKSYLTHAVRYVKLCRKRDTHQHASRRDAGLRVTSISTELSSLRDDLRMKTNRFRLIN